MSFNSSLALPSNHRYKFNELRRYTTRVFLSILYAIFINCSSLQWDKFYRFDKVVNYERLEVVKRLGNKKFIIPGKLNNNFENATREMCAMSQGICVK